MDSKVLEEYDKIINCEEYKEMFGMLIDDHYITSMYYLEDGTYIYVCWRYGSFSITKIFKDGKILYNQD